MLSILPYIPVIGLAWNILWSLGNTAWSVLNIRAERRQERQLGQFREELKKEMEQWTTQRFTTIDETTLINQRLQELEHAA
jgi:hypothetical protein